MQSLESNSEDLKDVSSAAHATTTVAGAVAATRTADVEPDGENSNGAQGIESKRRCEIEHEIKRDVTNKLCSFSSPCGPILQDIQDKAILPSFMPMIRINWESNTFVSTEWAINAIGPMEQSYLEHCYIYPEQMKRVAAAAVVKIQLASVALRVCGVHFCTVQAIAWEMEVRASVACPRVTFHMMGVLAHSNIPFSSLSMCTYVFSSVAKFSRISARVWSYHHRRCCLQCARSA